MYGGTYEKSFQKMNYFCIAKTYPVPSNKYIESTCTAGILEEPDGRRRLVRVYPMPFRYLEGEQQFPKYSWLEGFFRKRPRDRDVREDSYEIKRVQNKDCTWDLEFRVKETLSIKGASDPLLVWKRRMDIIQEFISADVDEVMERYNRGQGTLGIIKPDSVIDFYIEKEENEDWTSRQLTVLKQLYLFCSKTPKPLEKVPFRFKYKFKSGSKTYSKTINDWELYALYLNLKWRGDYQEAILKKVKDKAEELATKKDLHLFLGNVHHTNSFIIVGLIYPPKGWQDLRENKTLFT